MSTAADAEPPLAAARPLLEVCCDSAPSARAADAAGADRIELCVDLADDGLTPPAALLREVKAAVRIPVFVLVRCRAGGFVFAPPEIDTMVAQIDELAAAGADGIVCGALTRDGEIARAAVRRFLAASGDLPFTFHKGFDRAADLQAAMALLRDLGVRRVLTSGGARNALDGRAALSALAAIGGASCQVLCAGGVRSTNIDRLAAVPGVSEFHSAARASPSDPVDPDEVRALRSALDRTPPGRATPG